MKLAGQRGIRSSKWVPNEMLHADDINFVSEAVYTNLTALLASIARPDVFGETEDIVMQGFTLNHNNLLTCDFSDGIACSFSGRYLLDGTWGFVASAGDIFSVVKPVAQSVAFTAGGTFARIDLLEVRPIRTAYDSKSRQFKDPITGLVTSSPIDTKYEYGYEFAVREGDDTSALTKEQTTWTVNTATVGSDIAGKYVLFSTRSGDYYIWYNTGASGDPAVSGRTGIEVSINAGDDKDEIALATRTALNSHQLVTDGEIVISGATNQFIITVGYYMNVTDGTNGDMGSFFDAIAITQGNGVAYHTAGWIKIAEVNVGASASAITQNDILDVRDSDQWENESSGTRFIRWRAEDMRIVDVEDIIVAEEVEGALQEIGRGLRRKITVSEDVTAFDPIGIADSKFYKAKFGHLTSKTNFESGHVEHTRMAVDNLGSNTFVIAYTDVDDGQKGKVRVGEYSNGTITWKTSETEFEANPTQYVVVSNLGSNFFIVAYRDLTDSNKGKCRIGEFTGSAVTWKTAETEFEAGNTTHIAVASLGSNLFVLAFCDVGDTNNGKHRVGEFTGAAISWLTTATNFETGTVSFVSVLNLGNNHFVTTYNDSISAQGRIKIKWYDSGSITVKISGIFQSTGNIAGTALTYLDSGTFVLAWIGSNLYCHIGQYDDVVNQFRWIVSDAVVDTVASPDDAFDVALIGSNIFVISYVTGASFQGTSVIGRYCGGNIEWLTPREIFESAAMVSDQGVKVVGLGSNIYVIIWRDNSGAGYSIVGALPSFVGLITEAVTSGNLGLLQMKGLLSGMSGLLIGTRYFLDYNTGDIFTFGYDKIGKALSDTELLLD